ncbi:lysocardiolipin acyltransferase 1-like [Zophobas morio]|uniref:lysocardiolipin acyltransferase 1-like n=1 Tax=Zophobas morio TaxID=2755281 RepID=UPI003082FB06
MLLAANQILSLINCIRLLLPVAYAKKLNYPVYKYVMLPRVGAFIAAVQRLKEQGCQNIKDVTIGYSRSTPWGKKQIYNLLDALLIHAFPLRVHMHLRQFDISSVGETEEEMKFWLFKRFKEKDCLLYHFDIHQSFSSPDLSPPMEISPSAKLVIKDLLFWMVMQLLLFGFLIKIYFISDDYL